MLLVLATVADRLELSHGITLGPVVLVLLVNLLWGDTADVFGKGKQSE